MNIDWLKNPFARAWKAKNEKRHDPLWKCAECGKVKENYESMYCDYCWEIKPELGNIKLYCTSCGNVEAQYGTHCEYCGSKLVYQIKEETLDRIENEITPDQI